MRDLIYRRYHTEEVLRLPLETILKLIEYAKEKEQEEKYRAEWNAIFPLMWSGQYKYVSFSDYINQRTGKNIDTRPAWEIIAEIKEAHGGELP